MQTPACGPSLSSSELAFFASLRSELVSLRVGLCVFPSKEDGKPPASDSVLPSKEDGKPPASDSVLPSKEHRRVARSKVTSMYANVSAGGKIIYTKSEEKEPKEPAVVTAYQKLQADPYSYGAVLGKLLSLSNPTMKDLLGNFQKDEIMLLLKENRISLRNKGSRNHKSKVSRLICPSLRLICLSFRLICLSFRPCITV